MAKRNPWKEYRVDCCRECGRNLRAAWASNRKAFPEGRRFVEVEPNNAAFVTNLSLAEMTVLARNAFLRHRLNVRQYLMGWNPDEQSPWDEEA